MKVAIIGLGGIAQKAYLPVFAEMENVEIHLYTRNSAKLKQLSDKYRFSYIHQSIDSLIASGIEAAFVHSSTASHAEIVRQLLVQKIPVYVDKPISDHIEEARELTKLAKEQNTILMTGFNRRFVPYYQQLHEQKKYEYDCHSKKIAPTSQVRREPLFMTISSMWSIQFVFFWMKKFNLSMFTEHLKGICLLV